MKQQLVHANSRWIKLVSLVRIAFFAIASSFLFANSGSLDIWAQEKAPVLKDSFHDKLSLKAGGFIILEIPDLEQNTKELSHPSKWQHVILKSKMIAYCCKHFSLQPAPMLMYIDQYGNLLAKDLSKGRRSSHRVLDYTQRADVLCHNAAKDLEKLKEKQSKIPDSELATRNQGIAKILSYKKLILHPVKDWALDKRRELEADVKSALLRLMASEGLTPHRKLQHKLKQLARGSVGLKILPQIQRQADRLSSGFRTKVRD